MDLNKLIARFWKDIFPDNVIYLSTYRLERSKKYPGVGFRRFKDWIYHKNWMLQRSKELQRKEYNDSFLQKYKLGPYKKVPKDPV